jgi:uncharacterized protein YjeT (DUF2065 family)
MRSIVAWILGVALTVNGLAMLAAPAVWYAAVPGVSETGALNHHFIRDLGAVYLVAGLAMPWFALDGAARPAAQAGAAFLVMHAIVHLWDAAAGREHVHALLVEIPLAQNTVAVAHGGTLRGLIVQLGIHSAEEAPHLDIAQGVAYAISGGMLSRYA